MKHHKVQRALFCLSLATLLGARFDAQAIVKPQGERPPEIDVRGPQGVPTGTERQKPDATQTKAIAALESRVGHAPVVQYNALTATPRHLFCQGNYLTKPSAAPAERIALDFLRQWRGIWRFNDDDLDRLRLKSRTTLPDTGTTILLFEQQVEGIPVYRGEILVNVNHAGQIISVGSENFPQMTVTNGFAISPAQAVAAAATALGLSFSPQENGSAKVLRTFGDLPKEFTDGTRFGGGETFTDDIVVTRVIFPMGREGRAAYQFTLTAPQYQGMMWEHIVDAETGRVLRRLSLTSFQQAGGPLNSRRGTFRPDIQDMLDSQSSANASGKVFNGNPTLMSGYNAFGRPTRAQLPKQPGYAPDSAATLDGRAFRLTAARNRIQNPFADSASEPLFPLVYNNPFGQVTRGFPNALNPSASSPFGWFYLPTDTGGAEITLANQNRGATRAFGYTIHPAAKTRNAVNPGNSPTGDGNQPFAADLTALPGAVTLADGRTLTSVFQSRYTEGNNVFAADDKDNDNETTHGIKGYSANRQFTAPYFDFASRYEIDNVAEPDVFPGTVALFYYNNLIHDYLYSVGFTEGTWNFQEDNFGKGGAGNDAVSLQVQDGSGTNNANFSTPADGSRPRMQMFLFTDSSFRRADGDFDWDVVAHEAYHGVSNRSVGKGSTGCLGITLVGEANGMGEGWSDFFAASVADDDAPGEYATGDLDKAIRHLPYTNYRYSYRNIQGDYARRDQLPPDASDSQHVLQGSNPFIPLEVHDVGEYWAATLWDMRELLIVKQDVDDGPGTNFAGMFFDGARRMGSGTTFFVGYRPLQSVDTGHPINYRASFNDGNVATVNSAAHVVRPPTVAAEIQSLGHRNGPLATALRRGARLADTLVLRGMQLSPCNPSFVDMRDSILMADTELTGGENRAVIWRAFASHGVGLLASSSNASADNTPGSQNTPIIVEDFTVPPGVSQCEQSGPLAPPAFTLSTPANNTVRVTIPSVTGGHTKSIFRANDASGPFVKIAEIPNATTTYDDTGLSGGEDYFYQVRITRADTTVPLVPMANPNCVSGANTQSIVATGGPLAPDPIFTGVERVDDARDGTHLNLLWAPAISLNSANIVYDIYRVNDVAHGTGQNDPTFTPSAANKIAEGVTGLTYRDSGLSLGQVYFYIVQARDVSTGRIDTANVGNTTTKFSAPTIPCFTGTPPFPLENFSTAAASQRFTPSLTEATTNPDQASATFQRITVAALGSPTAPQMYAPNFSPGHELNGCMPDPVGLSCGGQSDFFTQFGPVALTATSLMEFDQRFSTEDRFDGGVIEVKVGAPFAAGDATPFPDNVTTFELGDHMIEGGYNSKLDGTNAPPTFNSTLQGRRAYSGIKPLHHVRISLSSFAPGGEHNPSSLPVYIRFRETSDAASAVGTDAGWYIDNLVINNMGAGTGAVQVLQAASRKTHGSAGTFDIPLPLTGGGIECRTGGSNGEHSIVFRFAAPITNVGNASVTSGTGSVSSSFIDADNQTYVVNLTGVANAQTITVTLNAVDGICGSLPSTSVAMGVLLGDTNGSGAVNSTDVGEAKTNSGQTTSATNFRTDVTVNGSINSTDVGLIKPQSGTMLPPSAQPSAR